MAAVKLKAAKNHADRVKKDWKRKGARIMTTRTWIGGGNNSAANPNDWSPTGAPQPADTLQMTGAGPYTMNVSDNALAGDVLNISGATATVNLSHLADVNAQVTNAGGANGNATFNLSGVSVLDVRVGGFFNGNSATVDLAKNSVWVGSFVSGEGGQLTANGGARSVFINTGDSGADTSSAVIGMPILGQGSLVVGGFRGSLELGSLVGPGQTAHVSGTATGPNDSVLKIDHPHEYFATTSTGFGAEIDLVGLAHADSYSYKNDMLSIYSGNKIIDTLNYSAFNGLFSVVQGPTSVNILSLDDPSHPPAGALPLHSGV